MIERVAPHGDALDREDREPVLLVVIACVIAKRTFERVLIAARVRRVGLDVALENDLGSRRYL